MTKQNGYLKAGRWVDKLSTVGRKWTTIFKGSAKAAIANAPNIYSARRRRYPKIQLRRSRGHIEARRIS